MTTDVVQRVSTERALRPERTSPEERPAPIHLADEGLRGEARKRAIVERIGHPESRPDVQGFVSALRRETARYWDIYVEPLITEHWPEVRDTPFYAKFKIGAQKVYAPAPYTVLVLSQRRPWAVRLLTGCCRLLRLPGRCIAWGLAFMLPLYTRLFTRRENRRIALMAAFIAAADEAFDHHLEHIPPEKRCELLRGLLTGTAEPPTASFRLVHALRYALEEGANAEELEQLRRAIDGCVRWGEAETRRTLREPDPEGICHRGEGIRNGIDGLAWTAGPYISPSERQWMYDVSLFIQMLDDWVDLEKDAAEGVETPVATGAWNLQTIQECFEHTTRRVVALAEENGESYPPYLRLIGDGYTHQVRDLLQNMVKGIAD